MSAAASHSKTKVAPSRKPSGFPMGWRRYRNYTLFAFTSVPIMLTGVALLEAAYALGKGEAAWNGWLQALRSPASLLLHVVLLVSFVVHAHSWFEIMPKTMPLIFVQGRRVSASAIQRIGWAATIVVTVVVFALALWVRT